MFQFIFGGKLGDLVAPRTVTNKELWSLIKGGLLDKALLELRNPGNKIDINELESSSGMALLHLTCAQGAMELVVELLSQGADIALFSADGNNCLHYAAINDRKGIVEILLRSGADPSIPNRAGILPVELAKDRSVRELFLRDRSAIFSPIVQTRMLLSDYVEQMHIDNQRGAEQRTPQESVALNLNNILDTDVSSPGGTGTESATAAPNVEPKSSAALVLDTSPDPLTSPARVVRQFSSLDSPASTTPSRHAHPDDYTLVGVASVKKPPMPGRVVEDYDSSENAAERTSRSARDRGHNSGHQESSAAATKTAAEDTPRKSSVPKLNLGGLATLSPPPTDAELALNASTVPTSLPSARSVTSHASVASSSGATRSNSINFYQPLPVPVPPVIGALTTPRTERTERSETNNRLASVSNDGTPSQLSGYPALGEETLDPVQAEEAELRQAVLQAAAQTSLALQSNRDDYEARRLVVRNCQKLNETHLRKLLTFDPTLPMSRATQLGNLAVDGQTPLHVAAGFGNTEAIRIMVEKGEGVSLWVRDLQGRTPLHVAAEKGHHGTCEYLREAMRAERHRDPVGEHAPTDLAGTTPLGWATIGSKGKPKQADMIKSLFSPGDRSVLPRTPVSVRAGKSPWKAPPTAGYDKVVRENVVFAFSEANGWTPYMEDRILVSCPVAGRPSWSLFGVCDGHGGAFCSEFLSTHIPSMLAKEAAAAHLPLASAAGTEADVAPEQLEALLTKVCVEADAKLAAHPRMFVDHVGSKFNCMDSSGSTAVLALVTAQHVAVANVGDSRAVLAVRPAGQVTSAGVLSSPFPVSPRSSFSAQRESFGDNSDKDAASGAQISASIAHLVEAVPMSRDHKATIPSEKARIEAAGATIEQVGQTVEGREPVFQLFTPACDVKLRMTRSFGDFYLKQNKELPYEQQAVVAVPEVMVHTRSARDAFLVLACDGIWDVMTSQEVADFMAERLGYTAYGGPVGGVTTQSAAAACDALLQTCLERGTVDNISVVLVALGPPGAYPPAHHSARGTPAGSSNSSGNLADALAFAAHSTTPASRTSVAAGRSAVQSHSAHSQGRRAAPAVGSDDSDVDMPIFDTKRSHAGSLNEIFAAVAEEERTVPVASPLNTAASASRVKKQLNFNES